MNRIFGQLLHRCGVPGFVRPVTKKIDGLTISVRTSPLYTIIECDGRELYFLRESGRFDGWGVSK